MIIRGCYLRSLARLENVHDDELLGLKSQCGHDEAEIEYATQHEASSSARQTTRHGTVAMALVEASEERRCDSGSDSSSD